MFDKILIANRGEIALRIIRACRELGIRTVAVYSEADADSLHVHLADEAICIGPPPATDSYLKIDRIVSAAEIGDVDAIHPGYGFLSENPHFAEVLASCQIKFIGPSPNAIRLMGDKSQAREIARKVAVSVTPGSDGIVATESEALRVARQIGYPVMIKAALGGGGRGMRVAHNDGSMVQGFHAASTEAEKAFGSGGVYIEKYIESPRHIEIQIVGDKTGHIVHLGERDCSIQRRHQKVVEECPSPFLTGDLRQEMGAAAIRIAGAAEYVGAGTVEFLMDPKGHYYFIEMNARIQVEHTITEEACLVDLVKEQILVAAGEPLSKPVANARFTCHAIQCRINAEDPFDGFKPSPGPIDVYYSPGGHGVRIDSHVYAGYAVPPHYDSMIAKLICTGNTRQNAIARMHRALNEYIIQGIKTTIPLHEAIMQNPDFVAGKYDTDFVERVIGSRSIEFQR
jgi:acetyl-CoA carboxylase biotin carboxylase subunit